MDYQITDEMADSVTLEYVELRNTLCREKEKGGQIERVLTQYIKDKINSDSNTDKKEEAKKILNTLKDSIKEYYHMANRMKASPSNDDFIRKEITAAMKSNNLTNQQQFELLSGVKYAYKAHTLELLKSDLDADGFDVDFMEEAIKAEWDAELNVAKNSPEKEEISRLLEQVINESGDILLNLPPQIMQDKISKFAENNDLKGLTKNINSALLGEYEDQLVLSCAMYGVLKENGVAIAENEEKIIGFNGAAGYEQAQAMQKYYEDIISAEEFLVTMSIIGEVLLILIILAIGIFAINVVGAAVFMFMVDASVIIALAMALTVSCLIIGLTLYTIGAIQALGEIYSEQCQTVKRKIVIALAHSIGYAKRTVLPRIKRVSDEMKAWVSDRLQQVSSYIAITSVIYGQINKSESASQNQAYNFAYDENEY